MIVMKLHIFVSLGLVPGVTSRNSILRLKRTLFLCSVYLPKNCTDAQFFWQYKCNLFGTNFNHTISQKLLLYCFIFYYCEVFEPTHFT